MALVLGAVMGGVREGVWFGVAGEVVALRVGGGVGVGEREGWVLGLWSWCVGDGCGVEALWW